jgi:hypothetical protein
LLARSLGPPPGNSIFSGQARRPGTAQRPLLPPTATHCRRGPTLTVTCVAAIATLESIQANAATSINNLNFVEAPTTISTRHTTTMTMRGPRATVERLDQPSAYFNSRVSFRCGSNRRKLHQKLIHGLMGVAEQTSEIRQQGSARWRRRH